MMPEQKPGRSEQSVETPQEFIDAVVNRFGVLTVDLAADAFNAKATCYFDKDLNSLAQDWSHYGGNLWCNPPYAHIAPWASKAAELKYGTKVLMLVPASIGSNWYAEHVHDRAYVLALNPRLTFVGHTSSYPKDLILCCYGLGFKGFDVWRWKD